MHGNLPQQKRRVLIGTPSYDGTLTVHYVYALTQTIRMAIEKGIDVREVYMSYEALVQNSRNDLVKLAIEHDFDDLVFIDADQDWQPEWLFKLLSYPVDCVGGTVRKKTDTVESYNVKSDTWPIPVDPETGLLVVDGLGAGFLRLSKRALRLLWDNSEPYRCLSNSPSRWIFDVRPIGGVLVGEDTFLSLKLKQLGILTYLDPSMTCGHTGAKRFTGDFAQWLKAEEARRSKAVVA